jgi:diadenosine tetraphosphate (Ap4A) HIT family hydrolase
MTPQWMPRKDWDALVMGENCPLCSNVNTPGGETNDYNYFIADLNISRLVLDKNQYVKGYCLLVCLKHVREPYELPQDERDQYFDDMMTAGLALEQTFLSEKMNFQILGNAIPHLHCHIEPRYYGDAAPGRPIDPYKETVILEPEEYRERVASIRRAIMRIQRAGRE